MCLAVSYSENGLICTLRPFKKQLIRDYFSQLIQIFQIECVTFQRYCLQVKDGFQTLQFQLRTYIKYLF